MLIVLFSVRFKAAGLPYFPVGGMYTSGSAKRCPRCSGTPCCRR